MARAFFALEIPAEVKERLRREINDLRGQLPKARWVRPEGLHLTLKFLGEHPVKMLHQLAEDVAPSLAERPPISVALAGSGFFPSPSRSRVAWIGGEAPGAAELAKIIDAASVNRGLQRERRRWALHLTLARLKTPWPRNAVDAFMAWGRDVSYPEFTCREVVLFESRLDPGGAIYTPLKRLELG